MQVWSLLKETAATWSEHKDASRPDSEDCQAKPLYSRLLAVCAGLLAQIREHSALGPRQRVPTNANDFGTSLAV